MTTFHTSHILYQSWEELPMRRLTYLLKLLPLIDWKNRDDWMNIFCKNMALKTIFKDKKLYLRTTAEQRVDLIEYETKWLQNPTHRFLVPALFGIHAPKDGLTDLSIERLAEADIRLTRYLISKRESYLHTFIACLYYPDQDFEEEIMQEIGQKMSKVQDWQKVSIVRSYMGSRMKLTAKLKHLFPTQAASTKKSMEKIKDVAPLWESLIHELANTHAYMGMNTAKKANAWEALTYMDSELRKLKKQDHGKPTV